MIFMHGRIEFGIGLMGSKPFGKFWSLLEMFLIQFELRLVWSVKVESGYFELTKSHFELLGRASVMLY